jgi:LPS export ABC transporter permease LptG
MKRLDLYLFWRYLLATAGSLAVVVLCALTFEFVERSRLLLGERASLWQALWFLLLRLPQLAGLVLPVSLVVAFSLASASLGRNLELTALASAGLGWRRLVGPAAACALAVTFLGLANGELLAPRAAAQEEKLQQQVFGWMDAAFRFYSKKNWARGGEGRLYQKIETGQGDRTRLQLHFYQLDENFRLLRRVHLDDAEWRGTGWQGSHSLEWEFDDSGMKSFTERKHPFYPWPEGPDSLNAFQGTPRAFGWRRLQQISRQLEARGISALAYRLEAQKRLSYPLCGLLLVLAAFPWQAGARRRLTPARALAEALGLVAVAYLLLAAGDALVGRMGAWPAGWLAPALLSLAAGASWIWKWND